MAVASVVFNGSRINAADVATGWTNYVGGGAAPAAEAQLAYQNSLAVNKKVISTTQREGVDYKYGSTIDMTNALYKLWFVKVIVADSFSLNTTWGVEVSIGSGDTSNFHQYNLAGSGSNLTCYNGYPPQGGYLITSIDPNIDTWREAESGTYVQSATTWWAVGAQFASGAAKSENVAMDAIDIGTGLTITAGDGASTEGSFLDFVTWDQNTTTNRYGVVTGQGNIVRSHGLLTIGTASVTEFLDTTSIVLFPDGYHSSGLVGVAVGMSHSSSIINIGSLLIGEGTINGGGSEDTRPDFVVTGTDGNFDCSATMQNFRNVTFTSICDVANADIECELLTQASANISNSTIRTNSLTSVACLQSPTFGESSDLHDVDFIQAGAGHAIELSTVNGSYTFTNLTFTNYGADGTDSAALDITAASGITTVNYTGTAPTYKTAGATVVLNNSKTLTVTVKDENNVAVQGAQVYIQKSATETGEYGHPANPYTSHATNNVRGDGTFDITQTVETDNPASGWLFVRDNVNKDEQTYRYTSRGGNTFTFPAAITGADEGGGTSTTIVDAGIGASGIVEGDTIHNTASPYQWAIVLSLDTNSATTTPLSAGGSWAGLSYSVNTLAKTYATGDTATVPLMNEETNASGIASESYNYGGEMDVDIRVRLSTGSTKYFPYKTTATISGNMSVTAVLIEDTIIS